MNISDVAITSLPDVSFDPPSSPPLPTSNVFPRHIPNDDLSDAPPSSDPVFSDDISQADEEPEMSSSRKRGTIRAPWFNLPSSNPPKRSKRELSRYVDSGVWLASESSDNAGDDTIIADDTIMPDDFTFSPSPSKRARTGDPSHDIAARKIRDCIDQCKELVDLSDLGLASLPSELLNPLQQLIRSRHLDVPMASPTATLTPGLGVYLSNNSIREIGPGLWNLQNIEVLSLRNNDLPELSEHVGRLTRLKELNIAGNQIESLPWSLLELIKGRAPGHFKLSARPNPLLDPIGHGNMSVNRENHLHGLARHNEDYDRSRRSPCLDGASDESVDAMSALTTMRVATLKAAERHFHGHPDSTPPPIYAASSRAVFFDSNGRQVPEPESQALDTTPGTEAVLERARVRKPWYRAQPDRPTPTPLKQGPGPGKGAGVPSLFELASRCCARAPYLGDMDGWRRHGASRSVDQALERAVRVQATGGMPRCSVCESEYLVHRAEWVEYWYLPTSPLINPTGEEFLPFLRRACSTGCVLRGKRGMLDESNPSTP